MVWPHAGGQELSLAAGHHLPGQYENPKEIFSVGRALSGACDNLVFGFSVAERGAGAGK